MNDLEHLVVGELVRRRADPAVLVLDGARDAAARWPSTTARSDPTDAAGDVPSMTGPLPSRGIARLAVERRLDLLAVDLLDAARAGSCRCRAWRGSVSAPSLASSAVIGRGIAEPLCAIERWNKPLRRRHRHHGRGLTAAAGLAEDRDAIRVAAEVLDVVLHPLQRRDQILHADVRRLLPTSRRRSRRGAGSRRCSGGG